MVETKIVVNFGIQAKKATEFVKQAAKFNSDIHIIKDEKMVVCKSIIGVMCLAIRKGEEITLCADGIDEVKAIEVLETFLMAEN